MHQLAGLDVCRLCRQGYDRHPPAAKSAVGASSKCFDKGRLWSIRPKQASRWLPQSTAQGMLPSCLQALRRKAKAGDKTAALELADADELFRNRGDAAEQELQQRHKVRRVDPTVNLAADSFDRWSHGFGLEHDPAKVTHVMWSPFPCSQVASPDEMRQAELI